MPSRAAPSRPPSNPSWRRPPLPQPRRRHLRGCHRPGRAGPPGRGGYGHGVAVGDYDNDGHPDLFVTRWRSYALLHNRGDGTFEDVTAPAGLGGDRDWPTSAAFADLDGDGDLDLYVCHYLAFDVKRPAHLRRRRIPGRSHYCSPRDFASLPDHVFRNDGGRFVDVTAAAGFVDPDGRGLGVVAADLDDDNRIDLYVANDMSANYLFRNLGGFRFEETALPPAPPPTPAAASSRAWASPAATSTATAGPTWPSPTTTASRPRFFRNLGRGLFADHTAAIGLAAPTRHLLGFGIAFLDANNDGRLDLISANGHVSDYGPPSPGRCRSSCSSAGRAAG